MSDTLMTTVIAGGVSLLVALLTSWSHSNAARKKLRREFALEYAAEAAVRSLLEEKAWKLRTFEEIRKRLGGFEDDQLRQLLVRAGAVRAYRREDDAELWGLVTKNPELIEKTDT